MGTIGGKAGWTVHSTYMENKGAPAIGNGVMSPGHVYEIFNRLKRI